MVYPHYFFVFLLRYDAQESWQTNYFHRDYEFSSIAQYSAESAIRTAIGLGYYRH